MTVIYFRLPSQVILLHDYKSESVFVGAKISELKLGCKYSINSHTFFRIEQLTCKCKTLLDLVKVRSFVSVDSVKIRYL